MKNAQKIEIGDRLAAVRAESRLSQREIGERLDVSWRTYQNCEVGTRELPAELLVKFCTEFDVRPEWVITGREPKRNFDAGEVAKEMVTLVAVAADELDLKLKPQAFGEIVSKLMLRKVEVGQITESEVRNYVELAGKFS